MGWRAACLIVVTECPKPGRAGGRHAGVYNAADSSTPVCEHIVIVLVPLRAVCSTLEHNGLPGAGNLCVIESDLVHCGNLSCSFSPWSVPQRWWRFMM